MSAKLISATALISGALFLGGAAYAAPFVGSSPNLSSDVQLVRSGSGGGGGGGHVGGGGGGGAAHVGGGGGGAAHVGSVGRIGGGSYGGRVSSGGHAYTGHLSSSRVTSGRAIARANVTTRGRIQNDGAYAARHGINRGTTAQRDDSKSGRVRHANRDWDHSWDNNHNEWRHHRRYYSYLYSQPWLYSDADCGWLYSRAVASGSAYWWSRYNACAG